PVAASHRRSVLSNDPVSTRAPSRLKATEVTVSSWPVKARIALPVAPSHRQAVLSNDPVSTRAPSRLKATDVIELPCPLKARSSLPSGLKATAKRDSVTMAAALLVGLSKQRRPRRRIE